MAEHGEMLSASRRERRDLNAACGRVKHRADAVVFWRGQVLFNVTVCTAPLDHPNGHHWEQFRCDAMETRDDVHGIRLTALEWEVSGG